MTYALHPMLFTGDPKLPRENPAQHKNMMHLLAAVWEEKELKTSGALIDVILSIRYIIVIHLGRRGQARCQVSWNHSFDDSFFFFIDVSVGFFVIVGQAKLCWLISQKDARRKRFVTHARIVSGTMQPPWIDFSVSESVMIGDSRRYCQW